MAANSRLTVAVHALAWMALAKRRGCGGLVSGRGQHGSGERDRHEGMAHPFPCQQLDSSPYPVCVPRFHATVRDILVA